MDVCPPRALLFATSLFCTKELQGPWRSNIHCSNPTDSCQRLTRDKWRPLLVDAPVSMTPGHAPYSHDFLTNPCAVPEDLLNGSGSTPVTGISFDPIHLSFNKCTWTRNKTIGSAWVAKAAEGKSPQNGWWIQIPL